MPELNAKLSTIEIPEKMAGRPISEKGFPVPWFVAMIDGKPDFRVADQRKLQQAVQGRLCWMCGQRLGIFLASVIGPMCSITRTISEPPSHRDCAIFAAKACPFLSNPAAKRNAKDLADDLIPAGGMGIPRNPGAVCVWISTGMRAFHPRAGNPGVLFELGDPHEVHWFAEGREATYEEIMASIDSGLPLLQREAARDGAEGLEELRRRHAAAIKLLPPPSSPNQEAPSPS